MNRFWTIAIMTFAALVSSAQTRKVQNKPYIDLRPMHFGISLGLNLQDAELVNVGPQLMEDGTMRTIACDVDTWNPGFSVGVVGDMRLSDNFNLRISPAMHFGSKRLTFADYDNLNEAELPTFSTQDLKNAYISLPVDLKISAPRFNNYRPYVLGGISPMVNLAGKDQEYVALKKFDMMVNVGMGCDFYLPFFKLIPEIRFCYGLMNTLDKTHVSDLTDVKKIPFTNCVNDCRTKMFVFTLYFE